MAEWSPKVRRVSGGEDKEKLAFINSLLAERRFAEADAEATKSLAQNGRSFGANFAKGRALQGLRQFGESLSYFRRAIEIDPMQPSAHLMAGVSAFVENDLEFAEEKFQTAVNIEPRMSAGYLGLAQVSYRRSDIDNAKLNVDKAIEYNPDMKPALLLRARILSKAGDLAGAVREFSELVRTNPENRIALISLAAAHMQQDNNEEAAQILVAALAQREDPIVYGLLGRVRMRLDDCAGAEAAIRKSMKGQSKVQNIARSIQLVEALIPQGKLAEARKLLDAAPRFGPLSALVSTRLGDLYLAEGSHHQAIASYRAALLRSDEGETLVAELDAKTSQAAAVDPAVRARAYRDAAEGRLQEARKSFAEQDLQVLLDRYRPVIAQLMETREDSLPDDE